MKYNKIELLRKLKNISKTELAGRLGMTMPGLDKMIKAKSMKVETLELLAEIMNVPVEYFFNDDEDTSVVNEERSIYGKKNDELTEKLLASKDEIIEKQKEEIQFLRGIIKNQK